MALPNRTVQQKAQDDSFIILRRKLRNVCLFREQTHNDYGIDCELELTVNNVVPGRFIKAQVKSAEKVKINKDGTPRVSGIKQSTLHYWIELSRQTPVIAYAVDLDTEEVFISEPLFWQATALVDETTASKTIRFRRPIRTGIENPIAVLTLLAFHERPIVETLHAHRTALRQLPQFLAQYGDVHQYDGPMPIHEPALFEAFLDCCRTLLPWPLLEGVGLTKKEKRAPFSPETWCEEWGEVSNYLAQRPMTLFAPLLIDALKQLRARILHAPRYWYGADRTYLQLVHDTQLPDQTDAQTLTHWGDHDELFRPRVQIDVGLIASGSCPIDETWLMPRGATPKSLKKARAARPPKASKPKASTPL